MAEFASKGVAGAGLGTGIAGLALGALNSGLFNNGLFNTSHTTSCGCSENMTINRYELSQEQKIAELTADKKLLEATIYTDGKLNDFRNYVDNRIASINNSLYAQAVYNATNDGNIACMKQKLDGITNTVVPITAVCPEPMKLYNSWTAPTTTA